VNTDSSRYSGNTSETVIPEATVKPEHKNNRNPSIQVSTVTKEKGNTVNTESHCVPTGDQGIQVFQWNPRRNRRPKVKKGINGR